MQDDADWTLAIIQEQMFVEQILQDSARTVRNLFQLARFCCSIIQHDHRQSKDTHTHTYSYIGRIVEFRNHRWLFQTFQLLLSTLF